MDNSTRSIAVDCVESAQIVLPCATLETNLQFFTQRLGFRVEAIFPADDPSVAILAAYGLRLRLQLSEGPIDDNPVSANPATVTLRLLSHDPDLQQHGQESQTLVAPNGTRIELVAVSPTLVLPDLVPSFSLQRMSADSAWKLGRAGMRYRDLIPDRQGGRVIASHITIPEAGPVPDYVHYHKVRFQMIYCRRGWVRVVYEDQGEPFVLHAGDCVLQPPEIRHRVLECSAGLEVIEIGSPAEHETHADAKLSLPTAQYLPARDFNGQRFVRHHAAQANFQAWRLPGYEYRDTGIAAATDGLASVHVMRPQQSVNSAQTEPVIMRHNEELIFLFVLDGTIRLHAEGHETSQMEAGDSVNLPAGLGYRLSNPSIDLELLEVIFHHHAA